MPDSDEAISLISSEHRLDPKFFRAMLSGLTISCPLEKNSTYCILHEKRDLSFEAKLKWVESLTDKQVLDLYSLHHMCFNANSNNPI